jgi:hypothetical protein
VELVLEDIVLQGRSDNNTSLVKVDGGNLVINDGAKITENRVSGTDPLGTAGGVVIRNGLITINGGEISGNSITTTAHNDTGAGGLFIDQSTVIMNGGKIANNTITSGYSTYTAAGVFVRSGEFTMHGGEISDNVITYTFFNGNKAGGLIIWFDSVFTMYGGKITRNTETGPGTRGSGTGGVSIVSGEFYMHGGEISANKSVSHTFSVGGVFINLGDDSAIFIKDGGIVYGTDEPDVSLRNTTGRANGAAVYGTTDQFGANPQSRNASLYENNNFDSGVSGSAGGWE